MSKKSFNRLVRICTGTFGGGRESGFSFEESFTKFEKFVHFWVLVWRSFVRNRCPVRASALSFTTLLALIPMLAVVMSISSALLKTQGEQQIKAFVEKFVEQMVPNAPSAKPTNQVASTETPIDGPATGESAGSNSLAQSSSPKAISSGDGKIVLSKEQAAGEIYKFIQNASSGKLGAIGVIFLLWTTIATLTRVEETFNDIWGVNCGRDWWSRITNYLTITLLVPILCIAALGVANSSRLQEMHSFLNLVPFLKPVISQLIPLLIVCVTFALFYKLMPNTKVNFSAALMGGALAGVTWHSFNLISIHLASRVMNASAIYGSLALVPLLMLGLYTVWVIVLFGAQVAYAYQNRESYLQERLAENVNQRGREFVALRLMTCIGQRFHRGLPPASVLTMSHELGIPSKLIQQVMQTLVAARLVMEVSGKENGYAPARPLETIDCHHILLAMRATQGQELMTRDEPVRAEVLGEFARIQEAEKTAAASVSMLAMVNRAQARLDLLPAPELVAESDSVTLPLAPAAMAAPLTTVFEKAFEPVEAPADPDVAPPAPDKISPTKVTNAKIETPNEDDQSFPL